MTNHLVIGCKGEVGSAIFSLLAAKFAVQGVDIGLTVPGKCFDVLHVCIPWSERFPEIVRGYQDKHAVAGGLTIIHSTVPVGTSEQLAAVHSPVRGVHPHLLDSLKEFLKYFGGERAHEAATYFEDCGVSAYPVRRSRDTEAMKLWCTTAYGLNIVLEKAIHAYCEANGLNFHLVYGHGNGTYNLGFIRMGMAQFAKYNLDHVPGPIGGHCVLPNCELLGGEIADFISKMAGPGGPLSK